MSQQTAYTLQLLDANNMNISPATNIESVYFERQYNDNIYRMSLLDKILIAGENLALNAFPKDATTEFDSNIEGDNIRKLKELKIPYMYATSVDGTPNSKGRILQLNTAYVSLSHQINEHVYDNVAKRWKECLKELPKSTGYLRIDGANHLTNQLIIDPSIDGASNVSTNGLKNPAIKLYIDKNNSEFAALNLQDFKIETNKGKSTTITENNKLDILCNNSSISLSSGKVSVNANNDIQLKVSDTYVDLSKNDVTVNASEEILLKSENKLIVESSDISILAENILDLNADKVIKIYDISLNKLNDKNIQNKEIKNLQFNNGEYRWVSPATLNFVYNNNSSFITLNSYSYSENSTNICNVYPLNIVYDVANDSSVNVIRNTDDNNKLYLKTLVSGDSSRILANVTNVFNDYDIQLCTINNNSILNANDHKLLDITKLKHLIHYKFEQVNYDTDNVQYKLFGAPISTISKLNSDFKFTNNSDTADASNLYDTYGQISYIDQVYYRRNGAMYATAYYASSDERQKTDIKAVDDSREMPVIKEFVWKDTSVKSYGFIAQELEKLGYNELVDTEESGFKKVDYNSALSLVVSKLIDENKQLKAEIAEIKEMLSKLSF